MVNDLTEGRPSRLLWRFSLPLLLSVIFQEMYKMADSVVAGKFINDDALAAVGASYPITMIFMAIAIGSNIGSSVLIGQLFGTKDYRHMKTAVSTAVISIGSLAGILTLAGVFFCRPLMNMLGTPANIMADSMEYLNVYVYGLIFLFVYNVCTGIFTALGDSKTPLFFLIGSSLANIGLDILFVAVFGMGVAGVAWATFICQGAASVMASIALLLRLRKTEPDIKGDTFSWRMLGRLSIVSVPSILQQSFVSVSGLLIQGLVNDFGSASIAGYAAAVKLNTFAITSFSTMTNALSSFTAQNVGAGRLDRVKKGFFISLSYCAAICAVFVIIYCFLTEFVLGLFTNNITGEAVAVGTQFLHIVSPFYLVLACKLTADAVLRGSGSMATFTISTFLDLIIRVALSYVLVKSYGTTGIWMSWPYGWVISAALSLVFYFSGGWRKKWLKKGAASALKA